MLCHTSVRRSCFASAVVTSLLVAARIVSGQTPPEVVSFTATTANMAAGNAEPIRINVLAWTSPADREKFVAAFKEKGETQLLEALKGSRTAGYVWTTEPLGYTLRYAHRIALPDGGERIILITDRPLGSWTRTPWKVHGAAEASAALTLVELRLNRSGRGEGKLSLAAEITVDEAGQTLALANYDKAPVLLKQAARLGDGRTR